MNRMLVRRCLALAGGITVAGASLSVAAAGVQTSATTAAPAFEVASVKPSGPGTPGLLGQVPRILPPVGGRFTALNVQLRMLVRLAYGLHDSQITGGPSWSTSTRFDITAKADDGSASSLETFGPMLRTLLSDRFALRAHIEPRDLPTFALVLARGDRRLGPALRASSADCSNAQADAQRRIEALARGGPDGLAALIPKPGEVVPCSLMPVMTGGAGAGFGLRASGMPLQALVALLTQVTGRIVRDETGLTGLFDWEMTFDPQVMLAMASQAGVNLPPGLSLPPSDSPSLLTALQEQLGLKLDAGRSSVDVLVIDSAEMPTPD